MLVPTSPPTAKLLSNLGAKAVRVNPIEYRLPACPEKHRTSSVKVPAKYWYFEKSF